MDPRTEWVELMAGLFEYKQHINLSEPDSVIIPLRSRTRHLIYHDKKLLLLSESQVAVGATSKGRSSSSGLGYKLRRPNAVTLPARIDLGLRWIPTSQQPAGESSRRLGRELLAGVGLW